MLNSQSLEFLEELYRRFLVDPDSVPERWRQFFVEEGEPGDAAAPASNGQATSAQLPSSTLPGSIPSFPAWSLFNPPSMAGSSGPTNGQLPEASLQERVDHLIRNYRVRGHRIAHLDPLNQPAPHPPELDPAYYGFTPSDLDRPCSTRTMRGPNVRTVGETISSLRSTYCRYIGAQFMHIDDLEVREWLQERMESTENHITLARKTQLEILTRLTDAAVFEEFLQKKFLGAKSFSLEGAESLIPLLHLAIEKAGRDGVTEIVLGMAHRGRLNVLANIMGKSPRAIFREFADLDPQLHFGRGDVKYHLGYSRDWVTETGEKVHLSLCFNPSHLEFVNPVAMGRLRAKQDRYNDTERRKGLVLLVHGDAAFCGEGVVQESLNLSELKGYSVGGTIHVIVNNQIGFTTNPQQSRSGVYCTDVAKLLQIPIFHVNGEHPEAVAQVIDLAMDFRKKFQRDAVIDMYCYRLRGHNEGDEPAFTQPVMYRRIAQQKTVRENYRDYLLELGGVSAEEAEQIAIKRHEHLEEELATSRRDDYKPTTEVPAGIWNGYVGGYEADVADVETGVPRDILVECLHQQSVLPENFQPHPKIARALTRRREMAEGTRPLDWATAESVAFGSLSLEGYRVRLTGQDCERGTFSQRHAVLHDVRDGQRYVPLRHLSPTQAPIEICNSPLSEIAVLGFDYGYSLDCPDGLVMWEAQFGDFVNAAQVIIDQFLVSAEDKWRRLSGLVLLLPHGFEGQGPEHSSARLERFLMMSAEDNIQVVVPSTPAQYFHMLRRQVLRKWRKPLIVMTPKSLLRQAEVVSPLEDLERGQFRRLLPDVHGKPSKKTRRVLLCSGKIYYELDQIRRESGRDDVQIIRIEQLYPLPTEELKSALAGVPKETPVVWVQEEPENMGAWRFLLVTLGPRLFGKFPFEGVCRPASASPATGSKTSHNLEQAQLISRAFGEGTK